MPYGTLSQDTIAIHARNRRRVDEIVKLANELEVPTDGNKVQCVAIANLAGALRTSARQLKHYTDREFHPEG